MLTIRLYQENDFAALCSLFLRAIQQTASEDYSPPQIAAWAQVDEARWRQKMAQSQVWVALLDQQPVGFITAVDHYIDLLFVSPAHSRQGIANRLLETLSAQIPSGTLTVEASITAKPFFEHHGFRVVEQQHVDVRGETLNNYRMEKVRSPG